MRDGFAALSEDLASINETVRSLSRNLEAHKNWTKSELADLQSSIDNPPTETISRAVLLKILPYMNDIEQNLFTDLSSLVNYRATSTDVSLSRLSGEMSELADLQSSIDSVPDAALLKLLPYMKTTEENLLTDLSSLISDRATSIDASVSSLSGDLEMYKNWTMSELADLQISLQSSVTDTEQLTMTELGDKVDKLVNFLSVEELSTLEKYLNLMFDPLNFKLDSLMNNSVNKVCDEVEEVTEIVTATLPPRQAVPVPCGGTGWRHVVDLNMTDPNTDCPSGWNETGYSKRTCGRASDGVFTCDSVTFPVSGGEYSQVCGRIKAYQWGLTFGLDGYRQGQTTIDDAYFSGVAVMHGSPRQHIWTFAAGAAENFTYSQYNCPCDTTYNIRIPPFVAEDYFCESGYVHPGYNAPRIRYSLHSNDTLWDGRDCHSSSRCCSFHNPPYFTKTLSTPTTDDIELRLCSINDLIYENVAVELIELHVKI
jgi:hypothetical protein